MTPRTTRPEPHRAARKQLLRTHPEIRDLFGRDRTTAVWISALVVLQLVTAAVVADAPWPVVVAVAFGVGAFAGQGSSC